MISKFNQVLPNLTRSNNSNCSHCISLLAKGSLEKKVFNIINDRLSALGVYSKTNVFWWVLVWNRRLIRTGRLLKKEKKLKNDKKCQTSQFFTKTTKFLFFFCSNYSGLGADKKFFSKTGLFFGLGTLLSPGRLIGHLRYLMGKHFDWNILSLHFFNRW